MKTQCISKATIDFLMSEKLITMKQSASNPDLYVVKYSRKVFYDNLWNKHEALKYCRGLVIDKDYNVIVFPFEKVYNRGENGADIPGECFVRIVRKVNGFMGAVTYSAKHGWIFSTTGSLDSDFVQYIKDYVDPVKYGMNAVDGQTYLFEICHPSDPHIVEEEHGAYLIGIRMPNGDMVDELTLGWVAAELAEYGIKRPWTDIVKMRVVNDILKSCQHEGFMVIELGDNYVQTKNVIKMKSPYYLVRKMIARKADIEKGLANAEKLKHTLEEELYCVIDAVRDNKDLVQMMNEEERLAFMTEALLKGK